MMILTQNVKNVLTVSNFLVNWATLTSVLLWVNVLAFLTTFFVQVDIPAEVWSQYPLILIGVVLVGWLARYWVANERAWRDFLVGQLAEREASHLRIIQLVQSNNEQLIATIEKNHQEQLRIQREGLKEVFDSELERVLDLLAKSDYYGNPAKKRRTEDSDVK